MLHPFFSSTKVYKIPRSKSRSIDWKPRLQNFSCKAVDSYARKLNNWVFGGLQIIRAWYQEADTKEAIRNHYLESEMMNELRIFDKSAKGDFLLEQCHVVNMLDAMDCSITKGEWVVHKGAYGYGEYVCSLEDELRDKEYVIVRGSKLYGAIRDEGEYFYHAHLEKESSIQWGVFDSTYYYVRSPSIVFLEKLQSRFANTILRESPAKRSCSTSDKN